MRWLNRIISWLHQGAALAMSLLIILAPRVAPADLRVPAWYDPNGAGTSPDWHYRVPIAIPAGAAVDSTIRLDVDFSALLAQLGVNGTFDSNSARVVRSNGAAAATQQYADTVYAGASDALNNGRGEIRFILQDNGPVTYHLYFDISQNGTKPGWDEDNTINGNFEFSADGDEDPPGWTGSRESTYAARVIGNEWGRTVQAGTSPGTTPEPTQITTDETARTGEYCYLMGGRDGDEVGDYMVSTSLERDIPVPAADPGDLHLRYRVKGWSSSDDGATDWDFIRIYISAGGTDQHVVGPAGAAYTTLPFSANKGLGAASDPFGCNSAQSGYGLYNGWDTSPDGTHQSGMTLIPGSEPWFDVTIPLAPFAGQNITLHFETRNYPGLKTWFHVDDVEWSVVAGSLGAPEAYGVNLTAPNDTGAGPASVYNDGDTLIIAARLDAMPAATGAPVTADLYDPANALAASGIRLFDNGTHGDATAGDAIWTNDGSVAADATYTFAVTDPPGSGWRCVVYARDASVSTVGAPDGLAHMPGRPVSPVNQANYYNVDEQYFTLVTPAHLMLLKSVATTSDPVNGSTNPKAIPGAALLYTIMAANQGGGPADADSIFITDAVPPGTALFVGDLGPPGGPVVFTDGAVASGLTYTYAGLGSATDDVAFSDNGGTSFGYTPSPDANGYDDRVTHIRINPKGVFNGASNGDVPSFSVRFRIRVE